MMRALHVHLCVLALAAASMAVGVGAEGLAPPSNLADATWDHGATDGKIFTAIKSGLPPEFAMEAWGDRITDPDIWNLVNDLRSFRK